MRGKSCHEQGSGQLGFSFLHSQKSVAWPLLSGSPTMIDGIYKGAASLTALERWQQAISQNLASAQVAGFKRNDVSFDGLMSGSFKVNPDSAFSDESKGVMPNSTSAINFAPGQTRQTGKDSDLAIEGPGFFQIRKPDGSVAYTRDGEFHINGESKLVTKQGFTVVSDGGEIVLNPIDGPMTVSPDGSVVQGDKTIGKLPVYEFTDNSKLEREDGFFVPADGVQGKIVEKPVISQGYIEGSNVSPLSEMVSLVTVSRAYEASQRVINAHDDTLRNAIQTLGNPNP